MPEVSVIVPVYNAAPYLEECIESILGQDFADIELILVEDGSTDASPDICRHHAAADPSRVKMTATCGKGLSDARNTGTRMACGTFVTFVDSDDKLLDGALSYLVAQAHSTGCPIVSGILSRTEKISCSGARCESVSCDTAIAASLYQEGIYHSSACGKLYRRELLADAFVSGRYYEDLQSFAGIYTAAGMVAVSSRPVYFYRPNPSSFINTWHSKRTDALWAVDSLRRQLSGKSDELRRAALARSFSAYYNIFNLAVTNEQPEIADSCHSFITEHRAAIIADRRVRLKDKLGALLSYCGRRAMELAAQTLNI